MKCSREKDEFTFLYPICMSFTTIVGLCPLDSMAVKYHRNIYDIKEEITIRPASSTDT